LAAGTVPYHLPFTLGHEIAGTVAAVADGVDNVEVGESVVVYGPWRLRAPPALQPR
jgi:alcohol dehydrogenase, propanol-preferring